MENETATTTTPIYRAQPPCGERGGKWSVTLSITSSDDYGSWVCDCKDRRTAERIAAMFNSCEGWTTKELEAHKAIVVSKRTGLPK